MKQLRIIQIILSFSLFLPAQTEHETDWVQDLEFIKRELPKRHFDLFFQLSRSDFEIGIDKIILDAPGLSEYEILDRILQQLAKIGDTHTTLGFGKYNRADKLLPFSLYWFSDGLYVMQAGLEYNHLLGGKLLFINDYPVERITDSLCTLIAIDNQSTIRNVIPRMISFVPHLEYFGFADSTAIKLTMRAADGAESITMISKSLLQPGKPDRYEPDSMAFCWRNRNAFFVQSYFERDSILYIQYNRCWSKELERILGSRRSAKAFPSFNKFQKEVFHSIEHQPVKKIIFDLRFNVGGSSMQGTNMIKRLARNNQVNQKGKLYVVTGIHTFSSGIINVMDFHELTQATFVGEVTSGRPNHYGEVKYLTLPSSGPIIGYSTKHFTKYEPDTDAFYPDVIIETSFDDFNNGVDPVFEYIRRAKQ